MLQIKSFMRFFLLITVVFSFFGSSLHSQEMPAAAQEIEDSRANLLSYSIETAEQGENYLKLELDKPVPFNLSKQGPAEYILSLDNSKPSLELAESVDVPVDAGQIRSARAVELNDSTQVRIFAETGTFLSARQTSSGIVVALKDAAINLEDVRAQAAEDAASQDAALEAELEEEFEEGFDDVFESQYTGRLISLDLQDTDIDNALRIIAEVSNLNIIASDDVTGKVTLRLQDVPWDQALDVILKTNGLDMVREGNVVRIAPLEKLRACLLYTSDAADE